MAGLVARFQRGAVSLEMMLPLLLAVLAGGFLGSRLGAMRFNPLTIQKIGVRWPLSHLTFYFDL